MKKIAIGLGCTAIGGALCIALWGFLNPILFVMEGAARTRITDGVSLFSWVPILVYIVAAVCTVLKYKDRVDTKDYQPLCWPGVLVLVVNLVLQALPFCLFWGLGKRPGDGGAGFLFALFLVCVTGQAGLISALLLGRPVTGKTRFFRADKEVHHG